MRRTRPIPWCQWLPCPRSPSTSPPSTASPHRKMGPTPPPPLTDTPPPRPPWLTRRCESWHPWPPCPTQHPLGRTTHKPLSCLRDCPHTETNSQEPIKYIHLPSSPLQHAPLGTTTTTMKLTTIMTMPVMWKDWDHWPSLVSRGANSSISCPDFCLVVTILVKSPNNAKHVLLIPDEQAENARLFQSTTVVQWNQWSQAVVRRPFFVTVVKKDWRSLLDCFFCFFSMWFRKCLSSLSSCLKLVQSIKREKVKKEPNESDLSSLN